MVSVATIVEILVNFILLLISFAEYLYICVTEF